MHAEHATSTGALRSKTVPHSPFCFFWRFGNSVVMPAVMKAYTRSSLYDSLSSRGRTVLIESLSLSRDLAYLE